MIFFKTFKLLPFITFISFNSDFMSVLEWVSAVMIIFGFENILCSNSISISTFRDNMLLICINFQIIFS